MSVRSRVIIAIISAVALAGVLGAVSWQSTKRHVTGAYGAFELIVQVRDEQGRPVTGAALDLTSNGATSDAVGETVASGADGVAHLWSRHPRLLMTEFTDHRLFWMIPIGGPSPVAEELVVSAPGLGPVRMQWSQIVASQPTRSTHTFPEGPASISSWIVSITLTR